jgi:hypothetical protein
LLLETVVGSIGSRSDHADSPFFRAHGGRVTILRPLSAVGDVVMAEYQLFPLRKILLQHYRLLKHVHIYND